MHWPDLSQVTQEVSRIKTGHGLLAVIFIVLGGGLVAVPFSPLPEPTRSIGFFLVLVAILVLIPVSPFLLRWLPPSESEQITALRQNFYIRSVGEGPRPISSPTTTPPAMPGEEDIGESTKGDGVE